MRSLRRYLSVFLVFVLLFGVFSINAYADETNAKHRIIYSMSSNTGRRRELTIPEGSNGFYISESFSLPSGSNVIVWSHQIILDLTDGSTLLAANRQHSITINNLFFSYLYGNTNTTATSSFGLDHPVVVGQLIACHTDGTTSSVTEKFEFRHNFRNDLFSLFAKFVPSKDVYQLVFQFTTQHNLSSWGSAPKTAMFEFGVPSSEIMVLDVVVKSEEAEQLEGISGKLTELFQTVKNGFTSIVTGVTELPGKLWAFFEEGLKGLFVPSEEDMLSYKDKWELLLSDRLGAVYQVIDKLLNSWDTVMSASQNGTIQFPQVAVILAGVPFSFGGWTVSVIPQRFQFFTYPVKSIVGIVCTISFVNGLRKRYDEVMGVEK